MGVVGVAAAAAGVKGHLSIMRRITASEFLRVGLCISVVNIFQNGRDSDVCLLLQFESVKPRISLLHLKGKPFNNIIRKHPTIFAICNIVPFII